MPTIILPNSNLPSITGAIDTFEAAVRDDEMKGAGDPEDIEAKELKLAVARQQLKLAIDQAIINAVDIL